MIDIQKINKFVAECPKPNYCEVDEEEWRNALLGAQESLSNTDIQKMNTDELWSHIWFAASYFCKGMMWAEEKSGLRKPTMWPRY